MSAPASTAGFELVEAVYLQRPTGRHAMNLEDLRREIEAAAPEVLFCHTQMPRLGEPSAEDAPPDDFSTWVRGVVQDAETAERLGFAVQTSHGDLDALRGSLLSALEALPLPVRLRRDAPEGGALTFLSFESIPVPTGLRAENPDQLMRALASLGRVAWFHHLIEEAWWHTGQPLVEWLRTRGATRLADLIERETLSGLAASAIRRRVIRRWKQTSLGRRLVEAGALPEDARREAGRGAVAGLMRRLRERGGET